MKLFGRATNSIEENERLTPEEAEKKQENILDLEVIKFVINEFPQVGQDIKDALENLIDTLDKSIDIIEDKSTEVIKESRDYILGRKYRETSEKLYEINKDINEYVNWMSKNLKRDNEKNTEIEENNSVINNYEKVNEEEEEEHTKDELIRKLIFEDFTGCEPYKLRIEEYEEEVDGWEEMIVRTADILNKNFKCDKNFRSSNVNKDIEIVNKKSKQNDSRDIIIEMLEEHNINLNNFLVYIKG